MAVAAGIDPIERQPKADDDGNDRDQAPPRLTRTGPHAPPGNALHIALAITIRHDGSPESFLRRLTLEQAHKFLSTTVRDSAVLERLFGDANADACVAKEGPVRL
jgi:hypothetical protein